ncbi:hypothetical protein OA84_10435 [Kaistella solincola]|uniref:PrgI family protein n=1 Tax=Kaistella solincola TaxID=510955 RepID=A0ABR4ZNH3_9FLAO|nr:hypothetical protein [Kaistella solincola]KIA82569.1 hypothetical protein OA84_10435 [Kaistella solincola]
MTKEKKNIQKTDGGIFRIFELITESIGWLQIVASPLLIGLIVGAIIYFPDPTTTRLALVATLGLVIGVIWATKQWKGKGTIWFMSRIMATPELDKPDEEVKPNTGSNDGQKGNR